MQTICQAPYVRKNLLIDWIGPDRNITVTGFRQPLKNMWLLDFGRLYRSSWKRFTICADRLWPVFYIFKYHVLLFLSMLESIN